MCYKQIDAGGTGREISFLGWVLVLGGYLDRGTVFKS